MPDERESLGKRFRQRVGSLGVALLATLALFLVLPVLQVIGNPLDRELMVLRDPGDVIQPPPPVELPEPEPEEEEQEEQPPEFVEQAQPLDLSQLELALNPGSGDGAVADFKIDIGAVIDGNGGEEMDRVFSLADLDQKPRVLFQRPPRYPAELHKSRREGTVRVVFVVDEQGRVRNPAVQESSDRRFEDPALEAVRQWKFEPGTRKGKKVQFKMRIPITFSAG